MKTPTEIPVASFEHVSGHTYKDLETGEYVNKSVVDFYSPVGYTFNPEKMVYGREENVKV